MLYCHNHKICRGQLCQAAPVTSERKGRIFLPVNGMQNAILGKKQAAKWAVQSMRIYGFMLLQSKGFARHNHVAARRAISLIHTGNSRSN